MPKGCFARIDPLCIATFLAISLLAAIQPAQAGRFSACNTKRCAPNGDAEACGREIHWQADRAKLQFAWDVDGKFISLRRELREPSSSALADDQTKLIARLENDVEVGLNKDAKNNLFLNQLVADFDTDAVATKAAADKVAARIAPLCSQARGTPLAAGVIIAANPAQAAQQARIAGVLQFCNPNFSINYSRAVSGEVWSKLRYDVANFARFETTSKQSDGHHAHVVSFEYDLDGNPGTAIVRMTLAPYLEFQFADRNEQSFRADGLSNCDLEDAAAVELMRNLGAGQ
jgi:hypothetical protein